LEEKNHHLKAKNPLFTLTFRPFLTRDASLPMLRGHPPSFISYMGDSHTPCLPLWWSVSVIREVSIFGGAIGSRRI